MPLLGVKSMTSLAAAYLPSAGTSDPSAEAAKLLSPSEYAAFRSESRHAARLLMAIALGCGSDTALLKNLQVRVLNTKPINTICYGGCNEYNEILASDRVLTITRPS